MSSLPEFDGCQTVARLESGPVADLYHAVQQPLGRPVLIKSLSTSILPSSPFAATLERESRLLAELHHPNILHLYDYVRRDGRVWLVLEHVDGVSLRELLDRAKPLMSAAACAIALEIARALAHAHEHGVIHRDVQPRNVLISRKGHLKLVNFSVAVDERLPTGPELLGGAASFAGPSYMSPEQILGEPPDPRSDLFSLGVVLYEMLSGRRPFDGPDDRSVTQRIRHDSPAPLPRDAHAVPTALERILVRCLEKLPSDRFHSAVELVSALEAALADTATPSERRAIQSALVRAGVTSEPTASIPDASPLAGEAPQRSSLGRAVRGLLACFALILLGGAVIQYLAARTDEAGTGRSAAAELALLPKQAGYLRVVADPWAHVVVNGRTVDTTPFARAIPLTAGTHYVRLEHPNAATERRTIRLVAGETVLLDVKMKIDPTQLREPVGGAQTPPQDAGSDAAFSP